MITFVVHFWKVVALSCFAIPTLSLLSSLVSLSLWIFLSFDLWFAITVAVMLFVLYGSTLRVTVLTVRSFSARTTIFENKIAHGEFEAAFEVIGDISNDIGTKALLTKLIHPDAPIKVERNRGSQSYATMSDPLDPDLEN